MGKFFVTQKGVFEEYSDDLFEGTLKVDFPINFAKDHDVFEVTDREIEEKLAIKFARMPLKLFQQTLSFLEWCHTEKKSEGFVAHRYIDGVWENVVFPQWNSSSSVCYHPELLIEKSTRVVGDTHSHPPSYGSGHSHTDGLDERKNNGIFVVVKGFTPMSCDPEIIGCVRGRRFHLKAESLFDIKEYDPSPSFPEEWKALVGNLPCDACNKKRESERKGKEITSKKEALENERKFRLIPKSALEVWRTEVAKEKETLGKKVKAVWEDYRKRMPTGQWPRLLKCDNFGCYKMVSSPKCDECQKAIGSDSVIGSIIDMLDEHQAFTENPEEVALIIGVLEEDAKKASPEAPAAPVAPVQTQLSLPAPEKKEEVKEESAPNVLIVATDKPCGKDCSYNNVPHQHAESKELLKKLWDSVVKGTTRESCSTSTGKCLYPEKKVCSNSCVWTEAGLSLKPSSGPTAGVQPLPVCKLTSCKEAGHIMATCEIRTALSNAVKYCPSKGCEVSEHQWFACEVFRLKERLIVNGDLERQERRFRCHDTHCISSGHRYTSCSEYSGPASSAIQDQGCSNEICQKGNHYFESCPIRKGRQASHVSQASTPESVVVGDSNVCLSDCTMKGKPHRHEISKAVPAGPEDADLYYGY